MRQASSPTLTAVALICAVVVGRYTLLTSASGTLHHGSLLAIRLGVISMPQMAACAM